jgi:hypothetical protein
VYNLHRLELELAAMIKEQNAERVRLRLADHAAILWNALHQKSSLTTFEQAKSAAGV